MAGLLASCAIEHHHPGDLPPADASILTVDAPRIVDAPLPPPPPADPVEVPIVTPNVMCTELVSANESATMFNTRLTTAGRTVCIANGVTITGSVQVGADNITIASPAVGDIGKVLNANGDTLSINGHSGLVLVRLEIESRGGSLASAIRVTDSSVVATETTARCEGSNCYALYVNHSTATIARSSLLAGLATQPSSTIAVYGWNGSTVEIADSTIRANGEALWDAVLYTRFIVRRCDLQSAHNTYAAITVFNSGASLLLQNSTVRTDRTGVYASGASSGVIVKLDGNAFRRIAGTSAGAKSPLESGRADDVFHSTAPNTFCNEGMSTTDGSFGLPLLTGEYSTASTFGTITQIGPIDCAN